MGPWCGSPSAEIVREIWLLDTDPDGLPQIQAIRWSLNVLDQKNAALEIEAIASV